jgi:8-oxo-dGTP pyrophosphatase MutT (NUDIX family)
MTSDIERSDEDIASWADRIRPIALVLFRRADGAVLVAPGFDRVKDKAFYRPLGGEIEFGELAVDAARREIREELAAEIDDPKLLGVFENIFTFLGRNGHELVWVFEATFRDHSFEERDVVYALEGDATFEVHWVPRQRFIDGEVPLFPDGLLEVLT